MAKQSSTHSKIGKSYVAYTGKIKTGGLRMTSQDISNWVRAINAAKSNNPKRKMLYELYDNIIVDGHLESVMEKRTISVINKKLIFTEKNKSGAENEFMQEFVLETPWMRELLKKSMEAIYYGHSLIELIPKEGMIDKVVLVPRQNVIPETGFVMEDTGTPDKGAFYREEGFQYYNYLIEVGGPKDLGKLMTTAQYIIYKRGGFGDWAQFAEIFGSPFRVGKYNKYDDDVRHNLEKSLNEMGSAPYAVIPEGASIEFVDNNQTGKSEVFSKLIEFCNSEISKQYVGQTMTTEDGSSRSQSEVHKEVEEELNLSDMIEMEFMLNWQFVPKLRNIGYNIPEGKIHFDQTKALPIEKRIEIDMKVSEKVPYPDEYWYSTYGVDKPTAEEIARKQKEKEEANKNNPPPADPPPANPKKEDPSKKKVDPKAEKIPDPVEFVNAYEPTDEDEQYIKDFFDKARTYSPEKFQKELKKLTSGIRKQFPTSIGYMEPDYIAGTMLELNLNRFGYSKTIAQVFELNKALDIQGGYGAFRKKAVAIMGNFDNYLQTEYNDAIATAQNAANYIRQMKDIKLFPYWRYETVGDDKVRASHAALDGKVFALKDVKSRQFFPPNEHNCRCFTTALRAAEVKEADVIDFEKGKKALGKDFDKMKDNGFLANRGETLEVFDLAKAYIDKLKTIPETEAADYTLWGLKQIAEIRKARKLKKLNFNKTDTPAKLIKDFEKNKITVSDRNVNILTDYSGREIAISETSFKKHLKGNYITKESRDQIWNNVKNILSDPDEVWLNVFSGESQYEYLKFFEDEIMVVAVQITKARGMEIKTWYISRKAENKLRRGILIK